MGYIIAPRESLFRKSRAGMTFCCIVTMPFLMTQLGLGWSNFKKQKGLNYEKGEKVRPNQWMTQSLLFTSSGRGPFVN